MAVRRVRQTSSRVTRAPERRDLGQLAMEFAQRVLAETPPPELPCFGELALAWLRAIAPVRVKLENERHQIHHLRALFLETESTLNAAMVEDVIREARREHGFGGIYSNKLRGSGKLTIEYAMARGLWKSPNPFQLARRHDEPPREYELLNLAELALVQPHIPKPKRGLFRVALHTGMRAGELFALRREDVDFERGLIRVRRSHGRNETKTGRNRLVPIVDAIREDLRHAIEHSPSELVFPTPSGKRQKDDSKLSRVLRTAMAAAGVGITGALYWCSRPRLCGWREEVPGPVAARRCPRCGRRCNVRPRVRPVRWLDLRHTCNTLHEEHGASEVCRKMALGHRLEGVNMATYTHPTMERMREELSRWHLRP